MNLVCDVLDQQLFDRKHEKCGKVDGLGLEVRDGEAPRVAYIEMSTQALARRISPRLARLFHAPPFRLPWSAVESVDVSVHVDIDANDHPEAFSVETWLRDHVITKIPGNAHHKHQEKAD